MFLSSSVNIHGEPILHVFGKGPVNGKATYSNVSKGKNLASSPGPSNSFASSFLKARVKFVASWDQHTSHCCWGRCNAESTRKSQ